MRLKKELIFVDTNVVVWFLKGRPSVIEFFMIIAFYAPYHLHVNKNLSYL